MSKPPTIGDPLEAYERARQGQVGGLGRNAELVQDERPMQRDEQTPRKGPRIARTYYLPPETAKWVKTFAATHDIQTSELVTAALNEYKRRHTDD